MFSLLQPSTLAAPRPPVPTHATFSFAFGPFSCAHTDWRPVIQKPRPPAAAAPLFFRKSRRLDLLDISGLLL